MRDDKSTTGQIGGDDWRRIMKGGIRSREEAASALMAISALAESAALTISAEHALRAKERIEQQATASTCCFGVCLCEYPAKMAGKGDEAV